MLSLIHSSVRWASTAAVLLCLMALGCAKEETQEEVATDEAAATHQVVTIDAAAKGLVFRYLNADKTAVVTASDVASIPESARQQVVVFVQENPAPAGWEYVADLRKLPATAVPLKGFAFQITRAVKAAPATPPPKADPSVSRKVTMFSTRSCPYCTKARRFFEANRVSFSEHDLQTDASARAKLAGLAQKAGVNAQSLQGVPIIFIGRQAIRGFDEAQIRKLLGI